MLYQLNYIHHISIGNDGTAKIAFFRSLLQIFFTFCNPLPLFALQRTHLSVSRLRKLTPSVLEGVNFCKSLIY